ncbi:unnamed protein product [Owenia fusiformis]|uniref:Sorting nexin-2 n=1 Tax=Owenia fusiformis TaxID=6347 RepID=A0A8S4PTL8_OWEFU|nr:unnamed protein product [Owenia fusiformis]
MADDRDPPPLFDDDEKDTKSAEPEDLFPPSTDAKEKDKEEPEDIFATGDTTEITLDDEIPGTKASDPIAAEKKASDPPAAELKTETPVVEKETPKEEPSAPKEEPEAQTQDEIEEEESGDQFTIEITVNNPQKVGDGLSSYMAYSVNTKSTIPEFKSPELSVLRRFSDFLGLHEKLAQKHLHLGRLVPPAPEKSLVGMTKVKMAKDESGTREFVQVRRAALERYLNRTAAHPILRDDSDFREFLEKEGDLPKATNTQAISGASMMRLINKIGDSVGKMTFKMDEGDQWFEEKHQQIEAMDLQLKKLHASVESLVNNRKDLSVHTATFARSAAMLGNAEEHTALSRALSQLAELEEKVEAVVQDQSDSDFYLFSELVKDYIGEIGVVKEVFNERFKVYKTWKDAEVMLSRKREAKAKLELARKTDKVPMAAAEITEWEDKVEKGEKEFDEISKTIRKEIGKFDINRVKDFKSIIIKYLETLVNNQQKLIKYWQAFLPEAKAIV